MRTDIVIRMQARSERGQGSNKAMKIAAAIDGVESVTLTGEGRNLLRVVGQDLDSNDLVTKLRKKVGRADIVELRTLQAGRGYASTSATGGGGYQSAHAGPCGDSAAYGQCSSYPVGSYSPRAAAADQYYRPHQPSYEYYQPSYEYPATVALHEYSTGDSTGCCSIM
uniref:Uncharacterized protein n=1 Tax=Avena sativa TaxID=4498 RepID=A0ACD5ZH50_AVESA